jgi:hypothetical protein
MVSWLRKLYKRISPVKNKASCSRILVTGVQKTGTTALYHAILGSLPDETVRLFEPESSKKPLPRDLKAPAIVKSFLPYSEDFDYFEKKILVIRDPRDTLISTLLYRPYNIISKEFPGEGQKAFEIVKSYHELIKRKESSPGEISVKDLSDHISVKTETRINMVIDYYTRHPHVFVLKYEDFIENNVGLLEKYLHIKIPGNIEVPSKYHRVVRTKSYGNWRSWFIPSDVGYFRPMMKEFLEKFGYKDDWELDREPKLEPGFGSIYLEKLIKEAADLRIKRNIK